MDEAKALSTTIKRLPRRVREWPVYKTLTGEAHNISVVLPLVAELSSPAMRARHWSSLAAVCRRTIDKGPHFAFEDLLALELHNYVDGVGEIVETAQKEEKVERKLKAIENSWTAMRLEFIQHRDSDVQIVAPSDEMMEILEENQMQLQSMVSMGRSVEFFRAQLLQWQGTLQNVENVLKLLLSVTKSWASLEAIFLGSQDIRASLPEDTKRFEGVDSEFKELMRDVLGRPGVIDVCSTDGREQSLRNAAGEIEKTQKALSEYLDVKKGIFPRFFFVSNMALLDILSNGNNPAKIQVHLGSVYDGIGKLTLVDPVAPEADGGSSVASQTTTAKGPLIADSATAMVAKDGETVKFLAPFQIKGAVEHWLNELTGCMQDTLRAVLDTAVEEAANWELDKPRDEWVLAFPAQISLLASQILWTEETEGSLEELENGAEDAVRKYLDVCNSRLEALIKLVQGELTGEARTKVITLITIDVHSRDMVDTLITKKVESAQDFAWQSQLKFYWEKQDRSVAVRVTDFKTLYSFEYVGNVGRLVITQLTDKCYVTLTTALRLFLGGAPAGPAGTGKTETTKDLSRGLGLACYVFNCSDQMNYQTMADIFRGLSQVGSWGCFDEFNRIPIEVLSVVASQVKTVQDAIVKLSLPGNRAEAYAHLPGGTPPVVVGAFDFFGGDISLIPTCGFFITMNPGYAGRTELPENLKALFRSCAMIRPDLKPICENMLMAEGFVKARPLAIKFVTLYQLSEDLLSKQIHYDWGLRNVKSVLRVAGKLKRMDPDVDEEAVLMRALRDFNTPKMPAHDLPVYLRVIADLFPGWDVPAKVNESLKDLASRACTELGYQHEEVFVGKVMGFQELLEVRHSVMLLGNAGTGKTCVWKTLAATHNLDCPNKSHAPCAYETVNPKSVTGDELYGYMTMSKEWKDGCLSIIMRGMCKCFPAQGFHEYQSYKWAVLDGDIDAVWIESMNTVMDDNKVLTLVSNERVPLSDAMRMVFEINSLKNATPATVSRAGILYINEGDIGWAPMIKTWAEGRAESRETKLLPKLFEKYVEKALLPLHCRPLLPVLAHSLTPLNLAGTSRS